MQPAQPGQPGADRIDPKQARAQIRHRRGGIPADARTLAKGGTREIIDRVGGGDRAVNILDSTVVRRGWGAASSSTRPVTSLTNYHVIEHATKATAQFKDGTECDVDGYFLADKQHDLAVVQLKIRRSQLTILPLAHVAEPQQGDDVRRDRPSKGLCVHGHDRHRQRGPLLRGYSRRHIASSRTWPRMGVGFKRPHRSRTATAAARY